VRQTISKLALAALGKRRRRPISVPYFTVAMNLARSWPFLATVPRGIALAYADSNKIRVLLPPAQIAGFSYKM
jgi:hypothetical protein